MRVSKLVPLLLLIPVFFLAGCASLRGDISSSNYRDKLKITKLDKTFYTGKYTGTESGCFPPITQRLCGYGSDNLYVTTGTLDMEQFEIQIDLLKAEQPNFLEDILYLAASDITVQRGYKIFTLLQDYTYSYCSQNTSAYTTMAGRTATTTFDTSNNCSGYKSFNVLLFRDKADLAKGVLSIQHSGTFASYAWPVGYLYNGSIPGKSFGETRASGPFITVSYVPLNAWKVHYDAPLLSKDLQAKYSIFGTSPYNFLDERTINASNKSNDPIQNRKVISPY